MKLSPRPRTGSPRVLVLTTYYHPVVGGVETHARQLASYLHRAGFDVQIVTKRVAADARREDLVDDVLVHRVGPAGERSASGKWLAIPAFFAKLLALGPSSDVIVCVDYRGIGVAAVAAARLLGRPLIVQGETAGVLAGAGPASTSGLAPESAIARLLKSPIRMIYRRSDHIVCIGRDLEREALKAGFPRDRVHYLPHGVDLERFRPASPAERAQIRRELGWPCDQQIVLFVGRLSREKGVMDLLEAWRLAKLPRALLRLVGPDMPGHPWDAGAPGRAFVEAQGLAEQVRFEGVAQDPSRYYRVADVFVQPSHFEALGNTALEAMASGLPVVAARVGGLTDFCVDGENAILHEPASPQSLATALERVVGESDLRARLGAAARLTAVDRFEIGALLGRYRRLIETTAASSAR